MSIYCAFQAVKNGKPFVEDDFDVLLNSRGFLARIFRPLFRLVTRSWHMFPIGFLFGLGFDTATEVALFGISAVQASKGASLAMIMVFPALFAAGMTLIDTTDGVLMLGAYGWAFMKPIRKLYYNLTITFVSVVVALLIGGNVEVPAGQLIGGTFQNLPLCTSVEQTQCVIAYRTFAASQPPTGNAISVSAPGMDLACTNPAALGGGPGTLRAAYFPLHTNQFKIMIPPLDTPIDTPFVSFPDFYAAECVPDAKGHHYLKISTPAAAGDPRLDPIPYTSVLFSGAILGTYILDYNFPLGDLLDLVDAKIAATRR